jgi:hypothetical protein
MKTLETSFASRVRLYRGALIAMLLAGFVVQSEATLYTISGVPQNGTSYGATYDTSQDGFTSWSANGQNQLALQTLYYSINGGSVMQLTSPTSVTTSYTKVPPIPTGSIVSGSIVVNYLIAGYGTVVDTWKLSGSPLLQTITFNNTSGSEIDDVSIFQYSDFVLGGSAYAGNQTVNMLTEDVGTGQHATANQSGGGITLGWQGFATADNNSGTTLVQANSGGATFGAFIGANPDPYSLDNTTLTANNNAVFGFQFSGDVLNGDSLSISETSAFPVPEPTSMALISSGMVAVALMFRQRRNKKA